MRRKLRQKWRVEEIRTDIAFYGGKVKKAVKFHALLSLALLGVGIVVAGCKSAPELSKEKAMAMIQAHYNAAAPSGFDINVNNDGMVQGATAKYWQRTTIYPNKYWADFKLTDQGKKLVKLPSGTDIIQWRPSGPTDKSFSIVVTTLVLKHRKARDLHDIQDVGSKTKTAVFTEGVDLSDLPQPLVDIARNPGNQLTTDRTATFVLDGDNWKLQSVD
jgi:hypothetical protein